ncbi:MAG: cupin domain-containing protein [Thermoplasmata archaeon]|jgi:quercetin dioxygenase-like cupin family protein|nr:cupin domain-containing protein [Thermoplasmata archaeon]
MPKNAEGSQPWRDLSPGIRQKVLVRTSDALLILYELEPSRRFPAHVHPQAQLGFLLQGAGRHTVEGSVRRVRAGDSYYIPPGVVHDFRTDPGEKTLAVDIIVSPTFEEASEAIAQRFVDELVDSDAPGKGTARDPPAARRSRSRASTRRRG